VAGSGGAAGRQTRNGPDWVTPTKAGRELFSNPRPRVSKMAEGLPSLVLLAAGLPGLQPVSTERVDVVESNYDRTRANPEIRGRPVLTFGFRY
jgi:hypothetical protein